MSHNDPDNGINHIRWLLGLTESLRRSNVSVYQHEWHQLAIGSWSLTAGTRHRSYLFSWDGSAGVISVRGPFHAGQGNASTSLSALDEQLGVSPSLDPFQYVERFFQSPPDANPSLKPTTGRRDAHV